MTDAAELSAAKRAARRAAMIRRESAHRAALDGAAQGNLRKALQFFEGKVVAGYMPMRTEVSPLPVMAEWARSGSVCVPVVTGKGQPLAFHRWTPQCDMVSGAFGAMIPAQANPVVPEVLIVPLLAFDARGARLGYGGGFYDRTLEALRAQRETVAIGFAYSAQQADHIPLEKTDQPLDMLVTERSAVLLGVS